MCNMETNKKPRPLHYLQNMHKNADLTARIYQTLIM